MTAFTLQRSFDPEIVAASLLRQQENHLKIVDRSVVNLEKVTQNFRVKNPNEIGDKTYIPLSLLVKFSNYKTLVKSCGFSTIFSDTKCKHTRMKMMSRFYNEKFSSECVYVSLNWLKVLVKKQPQLFKFKNDNFSSEKVIAEFLITTGKI